MQRASAQAVVEKLTAAGLELIRPSDTAERGKTSEGVPAPLHASTARDKVADKVTALSWEDFVNDQVHTHVNEGGHLPPEASVRLHTPLKMTGRDRRASHVIYTSGTSGKPKGVVSEHRSLVAYMSAKVRAHGIRGYHLAQACKETESTTLFKPAQTKTGADGRGAKAERSSRVHDSNSAVSRVLVTAAATWDPSLGDIFSTLGAGAVVCLAGRAAVTSSLDQVLVKSRATHVCTTPALWALLPSSLSPAHLPALEVLALGGAPFPRSCITQWGSRDTQGEGAQGQVERGGRQTALRLINTYGVTEACVYQTVHTVSGMCGEDGGELAGHGGSGAQGASFNVVGQALEGVRVEVEGDEGRTGGITGQVLLGGDQVARCYLGNEALSAEKFFVADDGVRWFRSGDVGRWVGGEGGEPVLQVLGRLDLQVKLRGFRIEVEEIEAVLLDCRLVLSAVVTVAGSPPRLVAWLRLDGGECGSGGRRGAASAQEDGERMLEDGGEVALRLLCMRRMPLHQVRWAWLVAVAPQRSGNLAPALYRVDARPGCRGSRRGFAGGVGA